MALKRKKEKKESPLPPAQAGGKLWHREWGWSALSPLDPQEQEPLGWAGLRLPGAEQGLSLEEAEPEGI